MTSPIDPTVRAGRTLRALTTASQIYTQHARVDLAMPRSDLAALGLLSQAESEGHPMTAGELSQRLGLTASATTALLDRLQQVGHLRRTRDPADGRRVIVEMTASAHEAGQRAFRPLMRSVSRELAAFTAQQLADATAVMEAMLRVVDTAISELGADGRR
ncbi:MAG: MarR family winged helix-turn-helix transcriptional regulator [Propioniciclava sp.]